MGVETFVTYLQEATRLIPFVWYCQWSINFLEFDWFILLHICHVEVRLLVRVGVWLRHKSRIGSILQNLSIKDRIPQLPTSRGTSSLAAFVVTPEVQVIIRQFLAALRALQQGAAPTPSSSIQAPVDPATLEAPAQLEGALPFQDQRLLGYFLRLTLSSF